MVRTKSLLNSKRVTFAALAAIVLSALAPLPAQAANFNVTYSTAGSTSGSAPAQVSVAEATTFTTASTTTLAKSGGFTFAGWSTAENAGGTVYTAGATFTMPAAAVTLFPVWSGSISFSVNGGTGTPSVSTASFRLGQAATLATVGTLARSGYTFAGWSTTATATSYTAGGGSFSTTGITASPYTLFATWVRSYSFNGNGSTVGTVPSNREWLDLSTGADLSGLGTDLKRRGFDFSGWSTALNGAAITGLFSPTSVGQVLYAVWKAQPAKQTIAFNFTPKKNSLSDSSKALLTEFAKKFDQTALFPKSSIQIFVGSTRHSSNTAKLGKDRIDAVTNYLKSQGVTAKFLWSNDVRKTGKATDSANNRIRIISTWVN